MKYSNLKPIQQASILMVDSIVTIKPKMRYIIAKSAIMLLLCLSVPILSMIISDPVSRMILFSSGIILLLTVMYSILRLRFTSWTITRSQLIYKRGVFAVTTDYMELYRVNDYTEEQTLLERILGLKKVVIHSTDKSNKTLTIFGIDRKMEVVTYLRTYVELSKRERNVYEIANY